MNREKQCFGLHSPHLLLALLSIPLMFESHYSVFFPARGTDKKLECFELFKTLLSVPGMEKNAEKCHTNVRGMDNNTRVCEMYGK